MRFVGAKEITDSTIVHFHFYPTPFFLQKAVEQENAGCFFKIQPLSCYATISLKPYS